MNYWGKGQLFFNPAFWMLLLVSQLNTGLRAGDCSKLLSNLESSKPSLTVFSRSSAERLFKNEQNAIDSASPDTEVNIELLFHPFYNPLGHTSLRVGTSIYEFTPRGWKVHSSGKDNARAFLFNNPFFRSYRDRVSVPEPYNHSVGVPIKVKVSQARAIRNEIESYTEPNGKSTFDIFFRNCNYAVLCVLEKHDVEGLPSKKFLQKPSSVLSFNALIKNAVKSDQPIHLYPGSPASIEPSLPHYLTNSGKFLPELSRLASRTISTLVNPPRQELNSDRFHSSIQLKEISHKKNRSTITVDELGLSESEKVLVNLRDGHMTLIVDGVSVDVYFYFERPVIRESEARIKPGWVFTFPNLPETSVAELKELVLKMRSSQGPTPSEIAKESMLSRFFHAINGAVKWGGGSRNNRFVSCVEGVCSLLEKGLGVQLQKDNRLATVFTPHFFRAVLTQGFADKSSKFSIPVNAYRISDDSPEEFISKLSKSSAQRYLQWIAPWLMEVSRD